MIVTPLVSESGQHSRLVALDACSKGPQFRDTTPRRFLQPRLERGCVSVTDQLHEGLSQCTGHFHLRMGLLYEVKQVLVFR
jgi:hypothetical protein